MRPPRPLPSPAVDLATPSLGPSERRAPAEPVGGDASQRRPCLWPRRAQGAARVALGVGVGAAARAVPAARAGRSKPVMGGARHPRTRRAAMAPRSREARVGGAPGDGTTLSFLRSYVIWWTKPRFGNTSVGSNPTPIHLEYPLTRNLY